MTRSRLSLRLFMADEDISVEILWDKVNTIVPKIKKTTKIDKINGIPLSGLLSLCFLIKLSILPVLAV